jgi:hypothetical protein
MTVEAKSKPKKENIGVELYSNRPASKYASRWFLTKPIW